MKNEFQKYDQIDRYLKKGMTSEELLAFEEAMEKNPELASEVQEMKLVNDTIFYSNLSDLKETMKADLSKSKKPLSNFSSKKIISGVVLLAGITGLGYYLLLENPKENVRSKETLVIDSIEEKKQDVTFHSEEEIIPVEKETFGQPENSTPVKDTKKRIGVQNIKTPLTATDNTDSIEILNAKDTDYVIDSVSAPKSIPEKPEISSKKTITSVEKPAENCEKTFEINTSPACKNTTSGEISVTPNVKGKYTYQINGSGNKVNGTFYDLSAGKYEVVITDGACTYDTIIHVTQKWCPQNTAFSFNPEFGEKWEIKHEFEDDGIFVIYNSLGKEIYRSKFGRGSGSWDGTNENGNFVDLGLYYAIIEYSDNRIEKVELTIIRK